MMKGKARCSVHCMSTSHSLNSESSRLRRKLREPDLSPEEKMERELDLANAEMALSLFQRGYELEQRIQT